MSESHWYISGLKFKCTGCGDCCTGAPGYVWVTNEEIAGLSELLNTSVDKFLKKYVRSIGVRKSLIEYKNGDCIFFDNDRRCCQVYEARPNQCRTWPFWKSNLVAPKAWQSAADRCPGCNHGPLISYEEIKNRKRVVNV
jgi:uncharacterized protein